jgi:hypothetical protein
MNPLSKFEEVDEFDGAKRPNRTKTSRFSRYLALLSRVPPSALQLYNLE